jgi:hypothetical protein
METHLELSNYRILAVLTQMEPQSSGVRQDDGFNAKENESIRDNLYRFVLPLNNPLNGHWTDKNIKDNTFNAEDIAIQPRFLNTPDYTVKKFLSPSASVVQDSKSEAVVEVEQYIRLKTMLQEEITESGIANPSEEIVETLYSEDKQKTNILLNELFLKNFHAPHIIVGVLHIISHFDYDLVSPEGLTMAIAALAHEDVEVREYGVKCFENWRHKDGIGILEHIKTNEPWLQNYINLVIRDLKNA